jgi:energy-coupling factor transport system permease protein
LGVISVCIITASVFLWPLEVLKKRLMPLVYVLIAIVIFHLVSGSDSIRVRLLTGFIFGTKILLLSLLVFVFTQTTSVSSIVQLFWFVPKHVRLMISMSFALVPVILSEIDYIRVAQLSRGLVSSGIYAWRAIIPILVPILNRTLTRAEQLAIVLESRGYSVDG